MEILGLVYQIFLYLEAFESNRTTDRLNHTVLIVRCIFFKFIKNLGEKDKRMFLSIIGENGPLNIVTSICFIGCVNITLLV